MHAYSPFLVQSTTNLECADLSALLFDLSQTSPITNQSGDKSPRSKITPPNRSAVSSLASPSRRRSHSPLPARPEARRARLHRSVFPCSAQCRLRSRALHLFAASDSRESFAAARDRD